MIWVSRALSGRSGRRPQARVAEARFAHWEEGYSLERGRPYWTNRKTGEVVWDDPHKRPPVGTAGPAARGAPTFEVDTPLPGLAGSPPRPPILPDAQPPPSSPPPDDIGNAFSHGQYCHFDAPYYSLYG